MPRLLPARTRMPMCWALPPTAWRWRAAEIRKRIPGYRIDDFLTAMQFAPDGAALFRQGAKRAGIE